jgi:uncharacterized repeat protein (TIGR03806 family)
VVVREPVSVPLGVDPPRQLSEMHLFSWDPATWTVTWNDRVLPYSLTTPLFSDYAEKQRALWVPEGEAIRFEPEAALDFPVGSVIIKNFLLPADLRAPDRELTLVETRLLIRDTDGWTQWPYVWEADGSDARLDRGGEVFKASFVGKDGEDVEFTYLVPQKNQCVECHELASPDGTRFVTPIGPKARYLRRPGSDGVDQLEAMAAAGVLTGLPPLDEVPAAFEFSRVEAEGADALSPADLEDAARTYLDINCAHCHNPAGVNGISSQLFLNHDNADAFNLGVCKKPGSAGEGTGGLVYDIVPGDPDASILVFRTETTEVGAMMPLLGRSLAHDDGAALVRRWVAEMPPRTCD